MKFDGVEYEEAAKPTLAEIMYLEKHFGMPSEEFSATLRMMGTLFVAVRRVDPKRLNWERLMDLSPVDIDIIPDEHPAPDDAQAMVEDPTDAGARTDESS